MSPVKSITQADHHPRLFILERTPLAETERLGTPPRRGDIIAMLRDGQDPDGVERSRLSDRGIEVVLADRLIDRETARNIDAFAFQQLDRWCRDDDRDAANSGHTPLMALFGLEVAKRCRFRHLVVTGEITRRLLDNFSHVGTVLIDLADGDGPEPSRPELLPVASLAERIIRSAGKAFRRLDSPAPLPGYYAYHSPVRFSRILKAYIGGYRPRLLFQRWALRHRDKPVVYIFMNSGLNLVAKGLAEKGAVRVVANYDGVDGATTYRFDHSLAVPKLKDLRQARSLLGFLRSEARRLETSQDSIFNGVNYGPLFARLTLAVLRQTLPTGLVVLAQTRRMLNSLKPKAVIINGDGDIAGRMALHLAKDRAFRIYFIRHGMNTLVSGVYAAGHNNTHGTYIPCGEDHAAEFGTEMPEEDKPRRLALGSPMTVLMNPVRGKRPEPFRRRVLLLNYVPGAYFHGLRCRKVDRYYVALFQTTRLLKDQGWSVTCRPHPGLEPALEHNIARRMGLESAIEWNAGKGAGTLLEALEKHDVVVTNGASTYYQCLYAGWPTVFFEPDMDPDNYIGLPADSATGRPLAETPEDLARLIQECERPDSSTARFPERFSTELAPRFIGKTPDSSDDAICNFLHADIAGQTAA